VTIKKTPGLHTGVCPKCGCRLVVVRKPDGGAVIRRHDCGSGLKARSVEPIPALERTTDAQVP
jgi:hypothetical protein